METFSDVRLNNHFFTARLLCTLHYAYQLQKKQKCMRCGPCLQGIHSLAGKVKGMCK